MELVEKSILFTIFVNCDNAYFFKMRPWLTVRITSWKKVHSEAAQLFSVRLGQQYLRQFLEGVTMRLAPIIEEYYDAFLARYKDEILPGQGSKFLLTMIKPFVLIRK